MTSFNLRQVKLRPGEQLRDELEVELSPLQYGGQAHALLDELRASGRKWVSGGDAKPPTFGREQPPEPPAPAPEQVKKPRSGLGRFFSRG